MMIFSKAGALLSAAVLLTAAAFGAFPQLPQGRLRALPLKQFAAQAAALPQPEAPFASLRYDAAEQQFYCDGRPAGTAYGDFCVSGGTLYVRGTAAGQPEKAFVPLEENADAFGCEIITDADGTEIRSPFQSCRLLVRTDADIEAPQQIASGDIRILCYDSPAETCAAFRRLQADSRVRDVCPDGIVSLGGALPDCDLTQYSWGCSAIGADKFTEWLKAERGSLPEIRVAVIDTGLYADHAWFRGRIAEGGISFADTDGYTDGHSHGTHCAGIIVQSTPENVKILPIKAMSDDGRASDVNIYCAVMYAVEQQADIISLSVGGEGMNWLIKEAVNAAEQADIPVICAAGNESRETGYGALSGFDSCVTISALVQKYDSAGGTELYELAAYSNFGSDVDFAAPGSRIYSAVAAAGDRVDMMSGTSMATPFAAAAYADLLSYDPTLTGAEIYALLKANARDLGAAGRDESYGWGMIDLSDFRFSGEFVPPPAILPAVVSQPNPFTVFIECPENTDVYYTLDGSVPTPETGILYSEPFRLEASAVLQAAAFSDGGASRTVRQSYCVGERDIASPFAVSDGVLTGYSGVLSVPDLNAAFPDGSLKAIGENAFAHSHITGITLPDSVTEIGDRAFFASDIKQITANGVTAVGRQAFMFSALETASLGAVDKLGELAFYRCERMTKLSCGDHSGLHCIPDYAFAQCNRLGEMPFAWENITDIGDHAFENCKGVKTAALPALRSLGTAAFAESSIKELSLPDTLTVLPDRVFWETPLQTLSAAGVTEIGADALRTEESLVFCDIDWTKVTRLGAGALAGMTFDAPVVFESLTDCGTGALDDSAAPLFVFPQLRHITSAMFSGLEGPVLLSGAEQIENAALIGCAEGVFVGDALRVLADMPFLFDADENGGQCAVLGGPAVSPLRDYAAANGLSYYTLPAVYPAGESTVSAYQYDSAALRVHAVSTEQTELQWFAVSDEQETELAGAVTDTYQPEAGRAGTFIFRAALCQDGIRVSETDFTLRRLPAGSLSLSGDGECAVIDWKALDEAADADQKTLQAVLDYMPEEDGKYYVTASHTAPDSAPPLIIGENGETAGSLLNAAADAVSPVTLKAGAVYRICQTMPRCETGDILFSVLRISQTSPKDCTDLSDYDFAPFDAVQADVNYSPGSRPAVAAGTVSAAAPDGTALLLDPETDYAVYSTMTAACRMELFFLQTGDYFSPEPQHQSVICYPGAGSIEAGTAKTVCCEGDAVSYAFSPAQTGDYELFCGIREQDMQQALRSGVYDPQFWTLPALRVFAPDGSALSLTEPAPHTRRVRLTAGSTYHISLSGISASERYTLRILPAGTEISPFAGVSSAYRLPDGTARTEELFVWEGQPLMPEPELWNNTRALAAGQDYTLYYLSNNAPGEMAVAAVGCGSAPDFLLLTHPVSRMLTLNQPEIAAEPESAFLFRAVTDGFYSVSVLSPDNTAYKAEVNSALLPDAAAGYPVSQEYRLKAGELLYITVSREAGAVSVLVSDTRSVSGGTLIPGSEYYFIDSDAPSVPCSITLPDGTVPVSGRDFTVSTVYRDGDSAAEICAAGIGGYSGCLTASLPPAFRAEADVPYTVAGMQDAESVCTAFFTPAHSGSYSLRTFVSPAVYEKAAETNYYNKNAPVKTDTLLRILDESGNEIGMNDNSGSDVFAGLEITLEAGTEYRILLSSRNPRGFADYSYGFIILDQKRLIGDLRTEPAFTELKSAALPEIYITAEDGRLLSQGTDFITRTVACPETSDVCVLVQGIGSYTGCVPVMLKTVQSDSRVTEAGSPDDAEIRLNVPFAHSSNQYFFRIHNDGVTLRLCAADGGAVSGSLTELSRPLSSTVLSDTEPFKAKAGIYVLRIAEAPEADPMQCRILTLTADTLPIAGAEIAVGNVLHTGTQVFPQLTVTDHGRLLHRDIDYAVRGEYGMSECGRYALQIIGLGRYSGSASAEYCILPAQSSGTLRAGTNQLTVDAPAAAVCMEWTPQSERCLISKSDLRSSIAAVFDSRGRQVCALSGIGYHEAEAEVNPGETYRVCVRFYSDSLTGTTDLTIAEEYRRLDACTVQFGERQCGQLPEYAVYDGEKLLTEGTDYRYRSDIAGDVLGTGFICFSGLGRYTGELTAAYAVSPESSSDPMIDPETAGTETELPCGEIRHIIRGRSGAQRIFTFTAPADETYSLLLPDLSSAMTAFVMLPDGSLSEEAEQITLRAGETLRILCITNIYSPCEEHEYYEIGVLCDALTAPEQFTADGISCQVSGAEVIAADLDTALTGIVIPETFTDPETGTVYAFGGISNLLCNALTGTHTVFGEPGGAVQRFCAEHGLCFAALEPQSDCAGDVTGDGCLTLDDILTIARCINECPGMRLSAAAFALADCNADGILDGTDLRILLEKLT